MTGYDAGSSTFMDAGKKCPICHAVDVTHFANARDIEYYTSTATFSFYRCDPCGILFLHPMPFDRLDVIYPPNYYSFQPEKSRRSMAIRIKKLIDARAFRSLTRGLTGESLAALDVGGGTGWLLDDLKEAEPRVGYTAVVDIDSRAEAAARRNGHDFHLTTFEELATKERYDVILMLNLLEHVPDPLAVLRKAKTLLKAGGRLWIKTPNYDALDARLFRHRSWGGFHTPRHFVLFDRTSLVQHCEAAGLQVVRCTYTQGAPFWTVNIINELKNLGITEVSAQRPICENPLAPICHLIFAALDFVRMPFSNTSQINVHLTH